ncbi:MAG: iron-containing alcohol dehydrogenase [Eubacteriales bacterium]|nr:iron-containing alcohol dehydrogenase [Eubacteriales bacterium]
MSFYNIYCRVYQFALKLGNYFMGYHMPDYIEGPGCVRQLPELLQKAGIRSVLLVTGPNITKRGLNRGLMDALRDAGIAYTVYNDIGANPTSDMVEAGVSLYHEKDSEGIIAFGGGRSTARHTAYDHNLHLAPSTIAAISDLGR